MITLCYHYYMPSFDIVKHTFDIIAWFMPGVLKDPLLKIETGNVIVTYSTV